MLKSTVNKVMVLFIVTIGLMIWLPKFGTHNVFAANLSDGRGAFATGSGTAGSPWGPPEAFDGNTSGSWCAISQVNGYFQMDLGASYSITGIDIYPRYDNANETPEWIEIMGSSDGGSYSSLGTYNLTGLSFYNPTYANVGPYRYIRFYARSIKAGCGYSSIYEVDIYGNPPNTSPTISAIGNQTIPINDNTGALAFTVGDAETAAGSLGISGVSNNQTLVPNGNIVFGGSGANRTVTVTPANGQTGTATITVTVTDGGGAQTSRSFNVTVNNPPTISTVSNQSIAQDTNTGALAFTVGDIETAAAGLVVNGVSSNQVLVPNANITFGGTEANRTVTIIPVNGQYGTTTITLTVTDGAGLQTTSTFDVTVLSNNNNLSNIVISSGTLSPVFSSVQLFYSATVTNAVTSITLTPTSEITVLSINVNGSNVASGNPSGAISLSEGVNVINIVVTAQSGVQKTYVLSVFRERSTTGIAESDEILVPGTNTNLYGDDPVPTAAPLGFTFNYYGNNYTSTNVSLNGNIQFNGTSRAYYNYDLPNAAQPNNMVAPFWDDLISQNYNKKTMLYTTIGETPNRKFIVQWTNMYFFSNPSLQMGTFQVILYEGSNQIQMQYRELMGSQLSFGSSATIGIENGNGTAGVKYSYNIAGISTKKAIRFTPNGATYTMDGNAVYDPIFLYDTQLPGVPILGSPSASATGIQRPVAFTWTAGGNTTSYRLLVSTDGNFSTMVVDQSNITTTTYSAAGLNAGTTYYWKVIANNSYGTTVSQVRSFTTGSANAPVISTIQNTSVPQNTGTGAIAFTLTDADTPLANLSVFAQSSNTTLVPNANITLGGAAGNRTIAITSANNTSGTALITIYVNDGTNTSTTTFTLKVNNLPTISNITDQEVNVGTSTEALAFIIGDTETLSANLVVTATSSNTNVVANSGIVLGGSGANRTITVTPTAGRIGSTTITVTVSDESGSTATDTFVVKCGNSPPVVSSGVKAGTEDTTVVFAALDFTNKYTDTESDSLTKIQITSLPSSSSGALKLNGNNISVNQEILAADLGNITFVPSLHWYGTASFNWKAKDANAYSANIATMSISIAHVNHAPTVSNGTKSGNQDTIVTFANTDFTSRYTDVDSDQLAQIKIISIPNTATEGILKLNNTNVLANMIITASNLGNLTFVPKTNFYGTATFTWKANDGREDSSNTATMTITINQVNHPPTVGSFTKTGSEDTVINFTALDFTSNYADSDGNALNLVKIISLPLNGVLKNGAAVLNINDTVAAAALGNINFTPNVNWNGSTSFTYKAYDGQAYSTGVGTITINIQTVSDAPVAVNSSKNGTEDTKLTFTAADFNSGSVYQDVDNDTLVKIKVTGLPQNGSLKLGGVALQVNSEVYLDDLSNINFVPNLNWNGTTSFTYKVYDGGLYSLDDTTTTINIAAVNDAPIMSNGSINGLEDHAVDLSTAFSSRYTDVEGTSISVIKIITVPTVGTLYKGGTITGDGQSVTGGTVVNNNDEITGADINTLKYMPPTNCHSVLTIIWKASDGTDYSINPATLSLNIEALNDKPTIIDVAKSGDEDTAIAFTLADFNGGAVFNDVDILEDSPRESMNLAAIQVLSLPLYGTLKLNGVDVTINQIIPSGEIGNLAFIPDTNWNGSTSFGWNVADALEWSTTSRNVNITVNSVNDAPVVFNGSISTNEDVSVTDGFSSADIDGDSLTYSIIVQGAHGTAVANPDGSYTYTPNANYFGSDSFTFKANDGTVDSNVCIITVNIIGQNDVPTVSSFGISNNIDKSLAFATNDFTSHFDDSADGGSLVYVNITELPTVGTLKIGDRNVNTGDIILNAELASLVYIPQVNYSGPDTFKWKGYDGLALSSNESTVTITVNASNHAPIISTFTKTGTEDTTLNFADIDFINSFSDVDVGGGAHNTLSKIKITVLPLHGILKDNGTDISAANYEIVSLTAITYVPNTNWNGTDSFEWQGFDTQDYSDQSAAVSISIQPVNDKPVPASNTINGSEDGTLTFALGNFTFSDIDGDSLSQILITSLPQNGTMYFNGGIMSSDTTIAASQIGLITFVPDTDWNGSTTFEWKANDGIVNSDTTDIMTINIANTNDLPNIDQIDKQTTEDTEFNFVESDFTSAFLDIDGDSLTKIKIVSLPSHGTLKLNLTNLSTSDEVLLANLGDIKYVPNANYNGSDSFTWNGFDGTAYAVDSSLVNVDITPVNDAPVVSNSSVSVQKNNVLSFAATDFQTPYSDVDSDVLNKIKIASLPGNGSFRLNGSDININDEINISDISNIIYTPDNNWIGNTSFNWYGNDGVLYSQAAAIMTIFADTPPVVSDSQFSGYQNTAVNFNQTDFISKFSDSDVGDTLTKIKITLLPVHGILILNGSNVTLNQEILTSQINSLSFVPTGEWRGNTTFKWKGSDGKLYSLLDGAVSIQINSLGYTNRDNPINNESKDNTNNNDQQDNTNDNGSNSGIEVIINNESKDNSASAAVTNEDGRKVVTVTVDDNKVINMLERENSNSTVTIPVKTQSDVVVGQLNGQLIKNMEIKEAVLEIKTEQVSYNLPASQINIDNVSSQIGQNIELKDIKVNIAVAAPPSDTVKVVEDTAIKSNYQIVVKPVEFRITCTSGDKTVEVSKFNGYVERTVAIPDGIDPSKITTGIILNADGTFSHVPTTITVINGKYYAKINSLTNSTYSVIYNPKEFDDVVSHWAKEAVNDMGSRLVINGVGGRSFEPERDITRAEFAAIVVRGLGIMRPNVGREVFSDVKKESWYYDAVFIASDYKLIEGYEDGTFAPNKKITREEAMAIMSRAMSIAKMNTSLSDREIKMLLSKFTDSGVISDWAASYAAVCIKNEVIVGDNGTINAKHNITRAETATIVRRVLQKAKLI